MSKECYSHKEEDEARSEATPFDYMVATLIFIGTMSVLFLVSIGLLLDSGSLQDFVQMVIQEIKGTSVEMLEE